MKSIIKWAGGKAQLLEHINSLKPNSFNNYFEPFIGGGAVLFNLIPDNAFINDINPELINMYNQVKNNVEDVIAELKELDSLHELSSDAKNYYYSIRDDFNSSLFSNTPAQAARFIYLNKHAFNGLYRVNKQSKFNVPFNNKLKGDSFNEANLREVSRYLKSVNILLGDFEEAVQNAKAGDFVFFDSPYAPLNPTSFIDYTKEGFILEDHERLCKLFKRLTKEGVYCMLTNHNTDLVRSLYKEFNMVVVQVSRNINSDSSNRKGEEVIITNYDK